MSVAARPRPRRGLGRMVRPRATLSGYPPRRHARNGVRCAYALHASPALAPARLLPDPAHLSDAAVSRSQLTLDAAAADLAAASTTNNSLDLATAPDAARSQALLQRVGGVPRVLLRATGGHLGSCGAGRSESGGVEQRVDRPGRGHRQRRQRNRCVWQRSLPAREPVRSDGPASGAAFGAATLMVAAQAGRDRISPWARPATATSSSLIRNPNDDVRAYKLTAGAFTAVGGAYPDANGRLDLTRPTSAAQRRARASRRRCDGRNGHDHVDRADRLVAQRRGPQAQRHGDWRRSVRRWWRCGLL